MPEDNLKLNVGCGIVYRPNYINIDGLEDSAADLKADALALPFAPGTVSLIEAHHLLEHFDLAHCRYVLAHWFRLLRPGGRLIIETPDIERAFAEFLKANKSRKRALLQWIYGIESTGMGHRTGFTFELLKNTLEECGFTDVRRRKQQTHRYESGLRVECRKPLEGWERFEFFAWFRTRILKELGPARDSMELIPLESHCMDRVSRMFFSGKDPLEILALTSVCNPELSRIFLETASTTGFVPLFPTFDNEKKAHDILRLIGRLIKMEFHRRLFTLWEISRKLPGSFPEDFERFQRDKESLILRLLRACGDEGTAPDKALEYIDRQPPADIDFFHAHSVRFHARKLLNRGIKEFHKGNLEQASEDLRRSASLDPDNYLTHWNLARVGAAMKRDLRDAEANSRTALKLAGMTGERGAVLMLKRELKNLENSGIQAFPFKPVSEFTITYFPMHPPFLKASTPGTHD